MWLQSLVVLLTLSTVQASPVHEDCAEAGTIARLECVIGRVASGQAPDDAETRRLLGSAYFQAGRWFEALEQYEHGLRLEPRNESIRLGIAAVFLEAGLADEAERALAAASSMFPDSGRPEYNEFYFRLGEAYADRGRVGDARRAMEVAARRSGPVDPVAIYKRLGDFLRDLIEPAAAGQAYARALELDPDDAPARLARAALDLEEGRLGDAMDGFRRVLRRDPDSAEAYDGIARAQFAAGRFSEAAAAAGRAVGLAPETAGPHYVLGRALMLMGQEDAGRRELAEYGELQEAALRADHRNREVHAYQSDAIVRFYRGDADAAIAVLQSGIARYPDAADLYMSLGLVLSQSGRHAEAVEIYSRLLALDAGAADRVGAYLARERRLAETLQ